MPTTATLHLPQPCAESWAAMAPVATGRHCAACQQVVVDFTGQTDAEILTYFQQARAGRTCGRFRAGQLGRPLLARPAAPLRTWQRWLAGVLAASLALPGCQPPTTGEVQPVRVLAAAPPAYHLTGDTVLVASPVAFPDSTQTRELEMHTLGLVAPLPPLRQ